MSREVRVNDPGPHHDRPWVLDSELELLAISHVGAVGPFDRELPWGETEPAWAVLCRECGAQGAPHDEELIAGRGNGEGGNHEWWRRAWRFTRAHVLVEHRDLFPEHRHIPPDLYGWWLMRNAAEREDMERRHAAEADALTAWHAQVLAQFMTPKGRI